MPAHLFRYEFSSYSINIIEIICPNRLKADSLRSEMIFESLIWKNGYFVMYTKLNKLFLKDNVTHLICCFVFIISTS